MITTNSNQWNMYDNDVILLADISRQTCTITYGVTSTVLIPHIIICCQHVHVGSASGGGTAYISLIFCFRGTLLGHYRGET